MIELPGFEVIVPNSAFINNLEDLESREIIVLEKILELTHDQVFEYFMDKFRKVKAGKTAETYLEKMIVDLPVSHAREILENPKVIRPYIFGHTDEDPQNLISVSYGNIPLQAFFSSDTLSLDNINELLLSDELREEGFGERWNMGLFLSNGFLPPLYEVQILLKHGKSSSDIHATVPDELESDHVEEMHQILPSVYRGLNDPRSIQDMEFVEEEKVLYSMAENSMARFVQFLEEKRKELPIYRMDFFDNQN